ncbi:MAG: ABC transporter permease [Anaerolineae bacterium]|nr:ABC transporter permease [Anaerolineae bacterium]
MKNVFLVIKHEILTTLGKPSFWLTTFVLPLFVMLLTFGSQFVGQTMIGDSADNDLLSGETPAELTQLGYVDKAGIIDTLPPGVPPEFLTAFPDEDAAQAAMEAGELDRYYLIPADYVESGKVLSVEKEYAPFNRFAGMDIMIYILDYNVASQAATPQLLLNPLPNVISASILPPDEAPEGPSASYDNFATFIVPFVVLMIFYFVLTMSGGFMLQSVTKEKENRVVEILLLSLRPRELMLGKLLGLGTVALLQMGIWLGGSLTVLDRGKQISEAIQAVTLPTGFVGWALLYFLFGYLVFASLLGALGALAPTAREGSQFTIFVLMPLMIPLFFQSIFVEAPNGGLVTFLSIFPLTAPVSMVTRMTAVRVPLWQTLLSLGLLAATAYGLVLLAARFFRADTLLSDASLSVQRIRNELKVKQR